MKKTQTDYIGTPKIRKIEPPVIETNFIDECFRPYQKPNDPVEMKLLYRIGIIFLLITLILLTIHYTKKVNAVQENLDALISTAESTIIITPTLELTLVPTIAPVLESREFIITGYCNCIKCCHKTDGITASGVKVQEGITCAADWSVLGVGSVVDIEGVGVRTVQDKGSSVKGDHIDVYFGGGHQEALNFGRQKRKVVIISYGSK
jgi:3D (Asp-Asp-Asp) domain-containing protein